MTPEKLKRLGEELAAIYVRRRQQWWSAIDRALEAQRGPELMDYVRAVEEKERAAARWDQVKELTDVFPIEIRQPMLEAVERLSM